MGNSPSRRVTVVNDDSVGIVQISDSVVQRLRTDSGRRDEKPKNESRKVEEEPIPIVESPPEISKPSPPPQISAADAYSTTLDQRKKFNEEFKRAEDSWTRRLRELQRQNETLLDIAENKLAAEIKTVEEKHMKQTLAPVCPDYQDAVEKCYKTNLKETLNCSKCVKDYMNCLEQTRLKLITSLS